MSCAREEYNKKVNNRFFSDKRMKHYTLYTDGACSNNGSPNAKAGWAFILIQDEGWLEITRQSGQILDQPTSSRAELLAAIHGLLHVKDRSRIRVVSDSEYLVSGLNVWMDNWINKKW